MAQKDRFGVDHEVSTRTTYHHVYGYSCFKRQQTRQLLQSAQTPDKEKPPETVAFRGVIVWLRG